MHACMQSRLPHNHNNNCHLLCNIFYIINKYYYVGLHTGVLPMHSTIIPMCLTVVLVTQYVAIPHQPAVEVRNDQFIL